MKTTVDEIAPDLFRISTYIAAADLQFNQFLVRDDAPLLFHTGLRGLFPQVSAAVAKVIDPATLRWLSFSHFEADECGSLNEWLTLAPHCVPFCGEIGALVNINDVADRRARVMADGEVLETGRHRFRYLETPQVPHGWDAGLLFEETDNILFCSDLLMHGGQCPALTEDDVVAPARATLAAYESGPLHSGFPVTATSLATLDRLARLQPKLLAIMHGASFKGDGESALRGLAGAYREVLGGPDGPS